MRPLVLLARPGLHYIAGVGAAEVARWSATKTRKSRTLQTEGLEAVEAAWEGRVQMAGMRAGC